MHFNIAFSWLQERLLTIKQPCFATLQLQSIISKDLDVILYAYWLFYVASSKN